MPLKFVFGVYDRVAPLPLSEPFAGSDTTVYESAEPSASAQEKVTLTEVSSSVDELTFEQIGASLTDAIVIDAVATLLVAAPSLAENVNESEPL